MSKLNLFGSGSLPGNITTQHLKIQGDIKIRIFIIALIGIIIGLLIIVGIIGPIFAEKSFLNYWSSIIAYSAEFCHPFRRKAAT